MKPIWPEEPWEAHGCALGMAAPGRPLEERLTMLGRRSGWSRRKLLGCGLVAAALSPFALVPWQVSAQERDSDPAELAQQWEDVLLLDAIRYLRLTPGQLQEIRQFARTTDERLNKLRQQEAKTHSSLARIARSQREALLAGKTVSLQEQANALLLEKSLRPARETAAQEITLYAGPKFVRLLSREQIMRALLLTHGEMPVNVAKRPALLDPQSGFILEVGLRETARNDALRLALGRRYPTAVLDALGPQVLSFTTTHSEVRVQPTKTLGDFVYASPSNSGATVDFFLKVAPETHALPPNVTKPQFEAAQRERDRLQKDWSSLANEMLDQATPDQIARALAHHVRRLFTSPRWKQVVDGRLRRGGQLTEEEPLP
jgi:hypothetical protein